MGNDSTPHLSSNLHLNFQIKMLKLKLRYEIGLLTTLQTKLGNTETFECVVKGVPKPEVTWSRCVPQYFVHNLLRPKECALGCVNSICYLRKVLDFECSPRLREFTHFWTLPKAQGGNSIGFLGRLNHGLNHRLTHPQPEVAHN